METTFGDEGKIKTFSAKSNLKEFVAIRLTLKTIATLYLLVAIKFYN